VERSRTISAHERNRTLWFLLGAVGFIPAHPRASMWPTSARPRRCAQKELAVPPSALGRDAPEFILPSSFSPNSLPGSRVVGGILGIGVGYTRCCGCHDRHHAAQRCRQRPTVQLNLPILCFHRLCRHLAALRLAARPLVRLAHRSWGDAERRRRSGIGSRPPRLRQLLVVGELASHLRCSREQACHSTALFNLLRVDLACARITCLRSFLPVPERAPKIGPRSSAITGRFCAPRQTLCPASTSTAAMTWLTTYSAPGSACPSPSSESRHSPILRCALAPALVCDPGLFKTFGFAWSTAVSINEQDTASSIKVMVVNEEFVKQF